MERNVSVKRLLTILLLLAFASGVLAQGRFQDMLRASKASLARKSTGTSGWTDPNTPLLWLEMEETNLTSNGTLFDWSPNEYNFTNYLVDQVTAILVTNPNGRVEYYLSGAGGADYSSMATNTIVGDFHTNDAFTVSFWCTTYPGADWNMQLSHVSTGPPYGGFWIFYDVTGAFGFTFYGGADGYGSLGIYSTAGWDDITNTWHHICCTYNGNLSNSGMSIYINSTNAYASDNADSHGFSADSYGQGGILTIHHSTYKQGAGGIDSIKLYNKALSAVEITNLYLNTFHLTNTVEVYPSY